jgi:hypothetical protein
MKSIEIVGKVFIAVGGKRKCLICGAIFTPTQAHAAAPRCAVVMGLLTKNVC